MSFAALNAAISGLRVAQQQLNVISNNVANVSTPGYSRKILPQSTQVIESTGQIIGVQAELIIRRVDLNLERDLWTQVSQVSFFDTKAAYLNSVQKFHGPPEKELSIAAEIAALKDDFAALADAPDDGFLLQATLDQAQDVASKFNDFGEFINRLRSDAQDDMVVSVARINDLLEQIASLNGQIRSGGSVNRSSAAQEDARDEAIKQLANEIDITFFQRGDGVIVVQTSTGVQLADQNVSQLFFNPGNLGPSIYYPASAAGVFAGGDPNLNPAAVDITTTGVGGKLGALIELRDETLMEYQAQIDELAHKMALRFDAQGLRLFTDSAGNVPPDTPPDLAVGPPVQPVSYVGFSNAIQVNTAVLSDITLLQQGTYTPDVPVPSGSNEVIRRVIEFTFGTLNYQEAAGGIDLRVAGPATDLQEWLGLFSENNIVGGPDLTQFTEIDSGGTDPNDLITTLQQNFLISYPANDEFRIQLFDRFGGAVPVTVDIDLSDIDANPAFAVGAADPSGTLPDGQIDNALDQVVAFINSTIITEEGLGNIPTNINARAGINANGQFTFLSRGDVEFLGSGFANAMTDDGFQALFGFTPQLFTTEHPYFDVQIGNSDPVRIMIEPGDTEVELEDKLDFAGAIQGVPGLSVTLDAGTGFLTIRPGNDITPEAFGGDFKIVSGPVRTNGAVNPVLAAAPAVNIASALFGSFTVNPGPPPSANEFSPITDVSYQSETETVAGVGSGVFFPFRNNLLGPGADIATGILSATTLTDYAQKIVNKQTQDVVLAESRGEDELALHDLLQRQLLDESGVNLDEELSNLIITQTAYAAAAKAVTAADELFRELLDAVR